MAFLTAAEIDRRYRALWDAHCFNQISDEAFAVAMGELRRAMRSLGA